MGGRWMEIGDERRPALSNSELHFTRYHGLHENAALHESRFRFYVTPALSVLYDLESESTPIIANY
jgi:hypothetical protein